ncbi:hypothetical protein C8C84_3509, partial [Flavobacterium sp. 102]
ENSKAKEYVFMNNNQGYSAELLEELKRNTEAVRKNKGNIILNNKIDFGHQLWKI